MRRTAPILAATTAALLIAAPAALAHHRTAAGAACSMINGAPTLTATETYQDFAAADKPIRGLMWVDGRHDQFVDSGIFPGSSWTWSATPVATSPGPHQIDVYTSWPNGSDEFHASVTCPSPPPPPPAPPVPVPPRVVPPPAPPVAPPAPPTPPAKPRHHVVAFHARLRYFNHDPRAATAAGGCRIAVEHPGMTHGLQGFRVSCVGGGIVHRSVRWRIARAARGDRLVGARTIRARRPGFGVFAWTTRGVVAHTYLFAPVYSRPHAWGAYVIDVRGERRVRPREVQRSSWSSTA